MHSQKLGFLCGCSELSVPEFFGDQLLDRIENEPSRERPDGSCIIRFRTSQAPQETQRRNVGQVLCGVPELLPVGCRCGFSWRSSLSVSLPNPAETNAIAAVISFE